jgi:hypothetical protein
METIDLAELRQMIAALENYAKGVWYGPDDYTFIWSQFAVHGDAVTFYVSGAGSLKAEGRGATIADAYEDCREKIAERDPVLLARTLGIEAA